MEGIISHKLFHLHRLNHIILFWVTMVSADWENRNNTHHLISMFNIIRRLAIWALILLAINKNMFRWLRAHQRNYLLVWVHLISLFYQLINHRILILILNYIKFETIFIRFPRPYLILVLVFMYQQLLNRLLLTSKT